MDIKPDWGKIKEEINLYSKHKKITIACALFFIFSLFGGIIYFAYESVNHKPSSLTPSGDQLQFGNMNGNTQSQQQVEGASTQEYGTQEPPATPSATIIPSASPIPPTTAPTLTPTPTPGPTSSPTNTPTSTPTSAPANTPTPTPTFTPTPIPPTDTSIPTSPTTSPSPD